MYKKQKEKKENKKQLNKVLLKIQVFSRFRTFEHI